MNSIHVQVRKTLHGINEFFLTRQLHATRVCAL